MGHIKSKSFFSYVFYQIIFSSLILSNTIIPENNSTLNYVHVLFEWEQEPGAVEYKLNISADNNFNVIILDTTVNSLVFIDKDNIEWSHNYFWRIKPVYIGQESTWSEINSFNNNKAPSQLFKIPP